MDSTTRQDTLDRGLAHKDCIAPELSKPLQLSVESDVTVEVYDVHGRLVRVFDLGMQPAGSYVTKDRAV
ncbi:TPA: hypothetical protein EYP66_01215 [Candidatus Poribacteria bacterium]|nr:hypothetical protein [Candidatus Poribacteria bacterium]